MKLTEQFFFALKRLIDQFFGKKTKIDMLVRLAMEKWKFSLIEMKFKIVPFKIQIYSIHLFAKSSNWTSSYADFDFIFIIDFKKITP